MKQEPIASVLDLTLERVGWKQAERHFDAAVSFLRAGEVDAYEREHAACKAILAQLFNREPGLGTETSPGAGKEEA